MFQWRKILGLVTLVIASAGPLPLWWHHAQCHSNVSCSTSFGQAHVDCNQNDTHNHTHAADEKSHPTESSAGTSSAGTTPACEDNLCATSVSEPSAHAHDCWACFQLSQSASVEFDIAQAIGQPITYEAAFTGPRFLPAAICGLFFPRGPPFVI